LTDNASRVYFKGLQLGDGKVGRESTRLVFEKVQYQGAVSASRAFCYPTGPSSRFESSFDVFFKWGWNGQDSTSRARFRDRVRDFFKNFADAMTYGDGELQEGPLSFVRDPYGTFGNSRDLTTSVGTISAGSSVAIDVDTAVTWANGSKFLIRSDLDPTDYEIATVISVTMSGMRVTANVAKSYAGTPELLRVEWYVPKATPLDDIEIPKSTDKMPDMVELGLRFGWTEDFVDGGLT
jgi:hypothetical protein